MTAVDRLIGFTLPRVTDHATVYRRRALEWVAHYCVVALGHVGVEPAHCYTSMI
jgi:hypothetical protein